MPQSPRVWTMVAQVRQQDDPHALRPISPSGPPADNLAMLTASARFDATLSNLLIKRRGIRGQVG
jgi:hypothetical protein